MKKLYILTLLFTISIGFSQNAGDLVITEIMQNPAAVTDANGEYFEIHNATNDDINIEGWTLLDDDTDSHVINNGADLIVPAEGYLVLGKNGNPATNGGVSIDYVYGGITLANGADEIILVTDFGEEIDRVNYDGGPNFPDPSGASMNLDPSKLNASDNDDGANWCPSTKVLSSGDFGSPGEANEACPGLSIADYELVSFYMYPNPTATGFVTIKSASSDVINVAVFDVLGKQVLKQTISNNRLNVSSLNAGIYVMRISQNNSIANKKLVIR